MEVFFPDFVGELTESEKQDILKQIKEDYRQFRTGDKPSFMTDLVGDVGRIIMDPEKSDRVKRKNLVACLNTAKKVVKTFEREVNLKEEEKKRYREMYVDIVKKHKELKEKYETIIQVRKDTKEEETQTNMEVDTGTELEMEVVETSEKGLGEKVESIIKRIEKLERKMPRDEEGVSREKEGEVPWTQVLGRRRRIGRGKEQSLEVQEEMARRRSRSRSRSLKALVKRLPKGSGVILEIQGGSSKEYEDVIKECEKTIPLKEMGIPSIGIRRTRGGGILMSIQGNQEEEKAAKLADRIRGVIQKKEGARVWSLRKRVRIRLTGLPPGAKKEEVASMIAREGGVEVDRIGVGPLRTSASGAGSIWVDCPREAAARVAGAPGLTMGSGGGLPYGEGGLPVLPLLRAGAPRAMVPFGNRPRGPLPEVR